MWTYCSYFLKKRPINFGKEEGVCPRAYYIMDSAFGAITISVLIFRKVMLYFPLRKIHQHFAVPVVTEDTLTGEVAHCDGFKLCQLAEKWFTSHSISPDLTITRALHTKCLLTVILQQYAFCHKSIVISYESPLLWGSIAPVPDLWLTGFYFANCNNHCG